MTPQEKFDNDVWEVLQNIRGKELRTLKNEPIEWVMQDRPILGFPPIGVPQKILHIIEEWKGLRIIKGRSTHDVYGVILIYTFELIQPKFDEIYKKYQELNQKPSKEKSVVHSIQNEYKILVKDREIWINEYLIGKPHAVGNNFEFFDYVRQQPPNTKIELSKIPDSVGWLTMKENIKGRRFIKILNALGFKGEIKKAFFYKVGKNTLHYRGDKVNKEDLEKAGLKFNLFLKELEVANAKIVPNSPV